MSAAPTSAVEPPPKGTTIKSPVAQNDDKRDHFDARTSKLVERTETSNVYENADGTRSADLYGTPVNYRNPSGSWTPIDNNLKSVDGKVKNNAGPLSVSLASTMSKSSPLGTIDVNGKKLDFKLSNVNDNVTGVIKDNTVIYVNAMTDTDIRYSVLNDKLKEDIILKSRPQVAPAYTFDLTSNGLIGKTKEDGRIAFQDKDGKDVIVIPQGTMYDSSEHPQLTAAPVNVTLNADGKGITVAPDPKWILSDERQYPLTIDPTFDGAGSNNGIGGYMDAFVYAGTPNTNYNAWPESGGYVDKAGYSPSYSASNEHYNYLHQDLGVVNGNQVLDARMRANFINSSSVDLKIYPVSQPWSASSVTWNNKPNHRAETISVHPGNGWSNIDITSWVANWAGGAWPNYGLSFDTAGQNAYYRWWSNETANRPYIHVDYTGSCPDTTLCVWVDANYAGARAVFYGNNVSWAAIPTSSTPTGNWGDVASSIVNNWQTIHQYVGWRNDSYWWNNQIWNDIRWLEMYANTRYSYVGSTWNDRLGSNTIGGPHGSGYVDSNPAGALLG